MPKRYLSFKFLKINHYKTLVRKIFDYLLDFIFSPFTFIFAHLFKYYRARSLKNFPISKKIFLKIGLMPIRDHYYEPLFNSHHLKHSLRDERRLPGIDFNDKEQLRILELFDFNTELIKYPIEKTPNKIEYFYNNGLFSSGDAEYLYNIIRLFKPRRIIEIGSGNSTLMARNAVLKNKSESIDYSCEHVCIEPYEQDWLEEIGIQVLRKKVEDIDLDYFKMLQTNDILFIDSSHIIRPQGDVLFEYLEILPILNKGVIIHIHDIFSPRDYLDEWFGEYLWNEQYLLEGFLTLNRDFKIIGATNYLSHKYKEKFSSKCPIYKIQCDREPGSFWMVKN